MKILYLTFALLTALPDFGGNNPKSPLTVTYVANEGFIIECGGKKIAIDALFGSGKSDEYQMPTDSIITLMKQALPPFDGLDLIAVTHYHGDHFAPELVVSCLRHNPDAILVCSPQVAEKLAGLEAFSEISNQIKIVDAPVDSIVNLRINGINISALPGKHGPYYETDEATGVKMDRHKDVQHLEFLITTSGRTIFHSGDAPLNDMTRYSRPGFANHNVDLALVQWFVPRKAISFRENLVRQTLNPGKIILMHLRPGQNFSGPENQKACADRNIIVPERMLEQCIIP
ncbi:hypothetical protein TRIP_C20792 [Candidatus Zixiibacteriota bacterium]|nr:hypothetical protein TRIP_C20792 [candidate division Zixibacteria bacterium]